MTSSQLYQKISDSAQTHGNKVALIEDTRRLNYSDLLTQIDALSGWLSANGIQTGDRVALILSNQNEFVISFFALRKLNAVVVPVNLQLPPEDMAFVLQNSGSKLVVCAGKFAPMLLGKPWPLLVIAPSESSEGENHIPKDTPHVFFFEDALKHAPAQGDSDVDLNQLALLMYTSGTTGHPKGVMLSENNLLGNLEGFAKAVDISDNDKLLMALPLFHAYGLIICLYAISLGATVAMVPNFSPKRILSLIVEEQISILPLVPTLYSFLLEGIKKVGADAVKSLRLCISGGASLPPALLKAVEETGNLTVLEGYGLTETSPVVSVNRPEHGSIAGSVGKPLHNVEVQLRDDAGNVVPITAGKDSDGKEDLIGEIMIKGPNVMLGYYNLPEETAKTIDKDGWLATGDLGHLDAKGNLYISAGRKKDLIIKAGENITPLRIEQVLYQHPAIQEASVIGVPDPKLGEDILACVQFREGQSASESELKKFCQEHLTAYMVPKYFRVYDELPKNPTGKIVKKVLREQNPQAPVSAGS